ncbi:MAG: exodeoxyribonuclease VII small subunit [Candidatus Dojkabacteria bacterium]|jgi:exodeoxyribonuclease VII small subunit|nr:exodeoxyribonuclease VII small subunit [Candidatus Dojkabacteria bacterium]
MAQTKKEKIDARLVQLEKIVKEFEKGDVGIEEGIEEYKKAAKLIKAIRAELETLESKLREIS